MAWIVDVELVSVDNAEPPGTVEVVFDVVYPGETWTRSIVRITPAALNAGGSAAGGDAGIGAAVSGGAVSSARDALLGVLELEIAPASVDMRLTENGPEILAKRRVDLG